MLRLVVRTWVEILRWVVALLVLITIGILLFNPSWRAHVLGQTDHREVTVAGVDGHAKGCSKYEHGDRLTLTWTDSEGTRTGHFDACGYRQGSSGPGDQLTLWVSPGHGAYDYPARSLLSMYLKAALAITTILSAIVLAQKRNRRPEA